MPPARLLRRVPLPLPGASLVALLLLACAPEQLLDAPPVTPAGSDHPELLPHAVALSVDVERGEVHPVPPPGAEPTAGGPGLVNSLIGNAEVTAAISNVTRGAPSNGRVSITFEVALTSLLNSGQLVTPTFPAPPAGVTGLLLVPFQIRDKVGPGTVLRGPEWDGAPFNFFNDQNCALAFLASSDCFPYEPFPAPLAAGATTASRLVGFNVDRRVTSFTVLMILAADIRNTPLPPPPTGAIAGRVTSPQAGALAGVSLSAAGQQATADVAGAFQLTGIPVGSATLTLGSLPPGCADPGPVTVTVLPGGIATADISVTCPVPPVTTGTITGTVTSTSRGALYGVAVVANPGNHSGATGLDGSYRIPGVPAGSVALTLANLPAGCTKPLDQTVALSAGGSVAAGFDVLCDPGATTGSLTGTLNGPGGPLAGVSVRLEPANLTSTSNTQGVYTFADLTPGTALVSFANLPVGCANPGTQAVEILRGRGVALNLQVNCLPLGSLDGVLRDAAGAPIAGASITLQQGAQVTTVTTALGGGFQFVGLAPGDYQLRLDKPLACSSDQAGASIVAYRTTTQVFTMDCPPVVFGRVTVVNSSFTNLYVDAVSGLYGGHGSPDADGRYRIAYLNMPLVYQVRPVNGPEGCSGADPVSVNAERQQQEIEVNFVIVCPTGLIGGTLTDLSGQPVAGATVTARLNGSQSNYTATTDVNGRYLADNLRAGSYQITSVTKAGCTAPTPTTLTVSEGQVTAYSPQLDCPPRLNGTVTIQGNGPLPQELSVTLRPDAGGANIAAPVAANGTYDVAVPAGGYSVSLGGVPSNCTAFGAQSVSLPQQGVLTKNWTVTCVATGGLVVTPADFDFGEVGVDVTRPHLFTLTNTGSLPVAIDGFNWSGDQADFTERFGTDCIARLSNALQGGATCHVLVHFTPTVLGQRSGGMRISYTIQPSLTSPGLSGTTDITFRGNGTTASDLVVDPGAVDFGIAAVGGSAGGLFTLANTGPYPTGLIGFDFAPSFPLIPGFGGCFVSLSLPTLDPGNNCAVGMFFRPSTTGAVAQAMTVRARPGGRVTVQLRGNGATTSLAAVPASHDFGSVDLDQTGQTIIRLTNRSNRSSGTLFASVTGANASEFGAGVLCPEGMAGGGSCDLIIGFRPRTGGAKTAIITVGGPEAGTLQIPVSGTGGIATFSVQPALLNFGDVEAGTTVGASVVVTNGGSLRTGTIAATLIGPQASDFRITGGSCQGLSLAPTARCTLDIQFTPSGPGTRGAQLLLAGAPAPEAAIDLTGNSVANASTASILGTLTTTNHPSSYFAGQTVVIHGQAVVADAGGAFRLTGLPPGPIILYVPLSSLLSPGCLIPAPVTLVLAAGEERAIQIAIGCGVGTVQGVVRDRAGQPVANLNVTGSAADGSDIEASTDTGGAYQVSGVTEGAADLRVSGGTCFASDVQRVSVVAGATATSNFTVNCPGFLSGIVSSNRGPLAGITVNVLNENTLVSYLPVSATGGLYTFLLEDGSFRVFVSPADAPAGCTVPPIQRVTLTQQSRAQVDIQLTCP